MKSFAGVREEEASGLARLLAAPRYEVIPVPGIEARVAALPPGSTVTVTASPKQGIRRTVEAAEALAAAGYEVVPHLAARMIADRRELAGFAGRLRGAGVDEVFVVGGDATAPAGDYADAASLMADLAALPDPFARLGVAGYPEGHPAIPDARLLEALRLKAPLASHVVTQICFDAEALARWISGLRGAGIELPVIVGLPGVVNRRRLAEISLQAGVGVSLRFLAKHGRQLATLARSRTYDPTGLARAVARRMGEDDLRIAGAHLFTFNQVEATRAWVDLAR